MPNSSHFIRFRQEVDHIELPQKFTYPFNYEPHPIAILAVKEVQEKLKESGVNESSLGKMYGILIVENEEGQLGYLTAFSGQLHHEKIPINFVPPISNRLDKEGFFIQGEEALTALNKEIETLENQPDYLFVLNNLNTLKLNAEKDLNTIKREKDLAKEERDKQRVTGQQQLSQEEFARLNVQLNNRSAEFRTRLKRAKEYWKKEIQQAETKVDRFQAHINRKKAQRRADSATLQQKLFDQYLFLNKKKETKSLRAIFPDMTQPPAGAGDCAAPKLLQYAFEHDMTPIALAEFWWGSPISSSLRKHSKYYPACISKCKPILGHMLLGIDMDEDPIFNKADKTFDIDILYSDEHLSVIHKPAGLLSVPAKKLNDSVLTRMQEQYPDASGPIIVHRLDQDTSGLMVTTKNETVYKHLQRQFLNRTIQKQYVAILDGIIAEDSGSITLPLTSDFEHRPMQKVCHNTGKPSKTVWKVLHRTAKQTRISFRPITGRTHQLRVHAAHQEGLNTPIVGDPLYGTSGTRMMLHAESIEFIHPVTEETLRFQCDAEF